MCGIVGFVGKKSFDEKGGVNGAEVVVDGLKRLEYRGYDSWGVAIPGEKKILLHKAVGKIGGFELSSAPELKGTIAIGHTRWATHGGVTEINSHPHLSADKTIAVVHNGIIENYQEMRAKLEKKGVKFRSQTDTEVIPQAIQIELKKTPDFKKAVRNVLNELEGSYAVAIVVEGGKKLIGARKGSPLVFGIGKDGYYLGSDVPAFLKYANKAIFLDDLEMVEADEKGYEIINITTGKKVEKKITKIAWSIEDAEKGGYPHFMIKEMLEQPMVLDKTAATSNVELKKAAAMIKRAKQIWVVACGTALHAGMYGSYIFALNNDINLRPVSAGEFPYFAKFVGKNDLVICVSQSGETADVMEAVKSAHDSGAKVLALVNVMGSSLMRASDYSIVTKAGPEICVLSTKAYLSQVAMFMMLSYELNNKIAAGKKQLKAIKADAEKILVKDSLAKIKKVAKGLARADNIYAIGRGVNYPTSLEACLKIKEVSYIHAEGFAGGDLKHGPIALIAPGTPVLVFVANDGPKGAPFGGAAKEIVSNAMEVKARGAEVIGISYENNQVFDRYFAVGDHGIFTGIVAIIYSQVLSYYIALEKKLDPDKPRNLAKSVTVK